MNVKRIILLVTAGAIVALMLGLSAASALALPLDGGPGDGVSQGALVSGLATTLARDFPPNPCFPTDPCRGHTISLAAQADGT